VSRPVDRRPSGALPVADDRTARRFFLVLLLGATLLLAVVARPLGSALFVAAVLAGAMEPLHRWLASRGRGRPRLAAGLLVVTAGLLLAGPLVGLAAFLVKEGNEALKFVSEAVRGQSVAQLIARLPDTFERPVTQALGGLLDVDQMVESQISARGGRAVAVVWSGLSATGSVLFGVAMTLIGLYFFLVEGGALVGWLDEVLPLRTGYTRELLAEFRKVSYAVIVSTVITAGVQSLAALAGYLISRMPHPVFFAVVTFFVAFVPAAGAASVCLFSAAILYVTGHSGWSLFLALWGLVVVGLVDNLVKPLLIRAGMEIRGAVVFFALLGGLGAFGPVGLLIGPLAVALFLALVRIYLRDFRARPGSADPAALSAADVPVATSGRSGGGHPLVERKELIDHVRSVQKNPKRIANPA
jgi:predicted PurR-regulated permease PerM